MSKECTITVGFRAQLMDERYMSYFPDSVLDIAPVYANSEAGARAKLRDALKDKVMSALEQQDNGKNRYIIGTTEGSIFLVEFKYGAWGYSIAGPDRKYASSCLGSDNFEVTRERARKHAEDGFGGIAWEHRY